MPKLKVLVVDDSALVRKILTDLINQDPGVEVVGTAADGAFAMRKIQELQPDVITLDVEMRNVGGLEFLQQLMKEKPLPVIMVSAHTQKGAEVTLKALELGAVDFVAKPQAGGGMALAQVGGELVEKIKQASRAKLRGPRSPLPLRPAIPTTLTQPVQTLAVRREKAAGGKFQVVAIGSSTGGTEALKAVLTRLKPDCPGIVIVQHMPEGFTAAFANRLNTICQIEVLEAKTGDEILPGRALVAPGHSHMKVRRVGVRLEVVLDQGPPVNRHRPSVEPLFLTVAQASGKRSIGIMLTGMGADGAQAMVTLKNSGSYTIAQDEETCVVFGMPKEAIAAGAVMEVMALERIADRITVLQNSH
jgi:two-component system, chemotaxis family, protein-glutamate methylesterase/glutaminase